MIPTIMGILNVTPDSFSDGGRYVDVDAAVVHARRMIADGATVIDVGGESTRPGAQPVSPAQEAARAVPVVEAIAGLGARISIDTRRADVARAAVQVGASLINDISASLWPIAADLGVGWLAMHMAGEPQSMQQHIPSYDNVCAEVCAVLVERARQAAEAGVDEVWIDPGFGFGKSAAHNLELVAGIDRFVETGFPVALGVSRKSTLALLCAEADAAGAGAEGEGNQPVELAVPDPSDRLEPAIVMAAWAMMAGVKMIRVHDVAAHAAAVRTVAEARSGVSATDPWRF
ncbi:MAG: dihydropteroate synthase [Actinobacteria bacterium]|nr:dihydropteroate synthase [Actinomycetota bacterium]